MEEQVEGQHVGETDVEGISDPVDDMVEQFSQLDTSDQRIRYKKQVEDNLHLRLTIEELEAEIKQNDDMLADASQQFVDMQEGAFRELHLLSDDALLIVDKESKRYKHWQRKLDEMKASCGQGAKLLDRLERAVERTRSDINTAMRARKRNEKKIRDNAIKRVVYGDYLQELQKIEKKKMSTEEAIAILREEQRRAQAEMEEKIRKLQEGVAVSSRHRPGRPAKRQRQEQEGKQDSDDDDFDD
jgi:chromosome segregation ATPase